MDFKTCTKCGQQKPETRFPLVKGKWRRGECLDCRNKRTTDYRNSHIDHARKLAKKRYYKDIEKTHQRSKADRAAATARGYGKKRSKRQREELNRSYVIWTILQGTTGLKAADIPEDVIELKKTQLLAKRLSRQLRKGIENESIENGS